MNDFGSNYAAMGTNLGRQLMQGANSYEDARTKMGQMLAQQGAYQAQANINNAKAADIQRRWQFQTPEYASKIAQTIAGLGDAQVSAIVANQSGQGWAEEMPRDIAGPPQTTDKAPSWATPQVLDKYNTARGMAMAGLTGDHGIDIEKLAKSVAGLTGTNMAQDRALAGGYSPQQMQAFNTFNAADKGKMFDQGAHGVMDARTGQFVDPALFNSAVSENRAQAGNAAASAAQHRAQIQEVQSRIDLNRSKIGAPVILTDKDGNQTVYDPKAKNEKPPTEFQAKSATYGARAKEAHDILNELDGKYSTLGAAAGGGDGAISAALNPAMSKETQRVIQAQRDFINAVLRQESGAVISPNEFANARKQYFPQPGDSQEVMAQKQRNRETAILGFKNSAGKAAFDAPPLDVAQSRKSASLANVPDAAIAHLRKNPDLAVAFAAKYGKEATDAALGKAR